MKNSLVVLLALSLTPLATSCHRTSCEAWEDTKTAGRYMNKGLGSFFGRHDDRYRIGSKPRWQAESEPDFLALSDDARYSDPSVKEYPISRESPGDPTSALPGIDGFVAPTGELAALFNNIQFETDSYTIKGSENVETLYKISEHLKHHTGMYVFVEGHADERGAASYNLSLGAKRASSIRCYLIDQGVNPDQLFTISYGKERPLVMSHDDAGWQMNRRGQFKLYEQR